VTRGHVALGRSAAAVAGACLAALALTTPVVRAGPLTLAGSAATADVRGADRQAVGDGALSVRISTIEPSIPESGDTLTVRGTITNVSDTAVTDVSAVLRVSTTPLPSRGEIPEILSGEGTRIGLPVRGTDEAVADTLAPGGAASFTLRAEVDSLGLGGVGVYMAGAEARGSNGPGVVRQDVDRTFLPWWPDGTVAEPLSLTTLWPVTSSPKRTATGTFLDEATAVAMSPEGRLSTIVRAASTAAGGMSLVLDPATVSAAAAMADGYEVDTEDGVIPGTRATEVGRWLDDLRAVLASPSTDATAMLYAMPDLVAARRGRLVGTLLRQREVVEERTGRALDRTIPAGVAMLADGVSDARTLSRLARADLRAAVLSDAAVVPTEPSFFTPSGNVLLPTADGDLPVLVTDSGLTQALALPLADQAERTQARQRLLAETLVTVTELPESPRLLVASTDPAWSPPAAGAEMVGAVLTGTPWIRPTTVAAALAREPSSVPRELVPYGDEQQARELSSQHVGQVRDQFRAVSEYTAVLSDPADVPLESRTAPNRGMSSWFRPDPVSGARLANTVSAQLAEALGSVRVVSSGTISVSGASGTIPVTVENVGPAQVTVGLTMRSDPPQLFIADPVAPFPIEPGQRTSLEVRAQVAAAGPITVAVLLTTAEGDPFGVPGELTVQSSAYANAARILVRAALVALALAVVVHGIRRARRMRRAQRSAAEADQPMDVPEETHG
jgi:hypothetical protein